MEIICISGSDANTFLQGQATCDINQLTTTPSIGACCNLKGRIVANFWIWQQADNFLLALPKSMTSILTQHLEKYALFSKVTLSPTDITLPRIDVDFTPVWILPETTEKLTPQMIDLQKQGGVSFTKGCYLGQEIIARTEHLGQLKRHLHKLIKIDEIQPNVGMAICNGEQQKIGIIVAVTDQAWFAVIEDRAIKEPLYLADCKITILAPG
jgi:tRNA-modifying protein YgfZ